MKYLDASIPICIETQQPIDKVDACIKIMESVEEGREQVRTSAFTIAEMFHILVGREKLHSSRVKDILSSFIDCLGIRLVDAKAEFCRKATEIALSQKVDFVDAHHFLTMQVLDIREIYSLDPHFDKLRGIKRLEKLP